VLPLSGCETPPPIFQDDLTPYSSVKLTEGDTLSITFPGSPDLNTAQKIRRDGKIDMKTVGEIQAAGKTPKELEKDILKLYEKDLVLKEVSVILQSTSYPVYVTGSVMHPGKVMAERPISALDAIMEAGGFDNAKANLKRVVVLRKEDGPVKHYVLNLKDVLTGKSKQLFYLRPNDIVYVPEKVF
jgi:polysaccharide export outer membrane protein